MRTTLALLCILPLLWLGCDDDPPPAKAKPAAAGDPISIAGLRFALPEGWVVEEPKSLSAMIPRLAQIRLPRAEGDDADGQLIVWNAMGSVDANIARWKGQFTGGDGEPAAPDRFEVDGVPCTLIDLSGTFTTPPFARRPGQPATLEGHRMIGVILETPDRGIVIKASGSIETIGKHREAILTFLKSGRR